MSKHQVFRDTIEAFQPGGADAPILYATTEMNEKGFQALLDRKIKRRSMSVGTTIYAFGVITITIISVISLFMGGQAGTPTFAAYLPLFVVIFLLRTTLITVNDDGLVFYFIDATFGSNYVVYDKFSLPYDRITNVKVQAGKFNTSFTFEFLNENKTYKIKTSVSNKMKKSKEQAENLKYLIEVLKKKDFNSY